MKFIDLCSGIGGFRLALESLGHTCVGFSEIDSYAIKVYKDNFETKNEVEIGDITKCKSLPEHNMICAGFPCQPFSQAGRRLGFLDDRADIFETIVSLASQYNTEVVVLENVKGLVNHNKGETFKIMLQKLKDSGYQVSYSLISGLNVTFQDRVRVYIVASLKEKYDFSNIRFSKKEGTLGEILEESPDEDFRISEKLFTYLKSHKEKHMMRGNGFGYTLCTSKSVKTRTISHRYHKDGSECLLLDKENLPPRKLTPLEVKRLFTFPDSFKINTSKTRAYMLLGNSVIVDLVREICRHLII